MADQQDSPAPTGPVQVLVVGFGAAGASAAITARRLGASVLVLEKQAVAAHTPSTRMSGGLIMGMTDAAAGARYLGLCAGGMIPGAVSAAWARRAVELRDWLDELVPELELSAIGGAEQRELDGAEAVTVFQPGGSDARLDTSFGAMGSNWFRVSGSPPARSCSMNGAPTISRRSRPA